MRKFARGFFFLLCVAGLGGGFLFGGGKSDSKAPLPEGTPLGGPSATNLSADVVAKITLTKSEVIYVKQLQLEVERRVKMQEVPRDMAQLELRRRILDAMISERLVLQAAERAGVTSPKAEVDQQIQQLRASVGRPLTDQEFSEGIEQQYGLTYTAFQTYLRDEMVKQKYLQQYVMEAADRVKAGNSVSEAEIDEAIAGLRDQLAAQIGRPPTDAEFSEAVRQQGGDVAGLRGQARQQLTMQKYLIAMGGGGPQDEEILTVYNRSKAQFVRPDTISFDYIQIPFRADTKAAAKTRADDLAKKIGSSASAFNVEFAATAANSAGSLRYIPLSADDPRIQQGFGVEFIDKAMPLAEGRVSGVIEGPQTFFIIKITSKFPQANLGLDDIYRLGSAATVRDLITSELMQRNFTNGMAVVTNTLAEDLRKEGSVEIYENFLYW